MYKKLRIKLGPLFAMLSIAAGVVLLVYPPVSFSPEESKAAALAVIIIGFWATVIIPEFLTALFFFLFAMLFSVSPPNVVFSGFESTALWLVFGGLVLGVGITETGLGNRIAGKIVVHLDGSYFRLISGVVIVGTVLSFFMPAGMGRVILLIPVALAITNHFGFKEGSNGRTGIILAAILGTLIPAYTILPANVPNIVLVGMSETQFQISLLYGEYMLLHFPVLGALKTVVVIGLILWFFPDRPNKNDIGELLSIGPMSKNETVLSLIIAIQLALWMTDFSHNISPAWIALGGALLLLLPAINIVNRQQFNGKINYGSLFFAAGILGLGGMITHSGLGDTLANKLITSLPLYEDSPFLNYISLGLLSMLTGLTTTVVGVPAVITPLSDTLAQVTGLPIKTVLMTQVLGFSTPIFPYQVPPIVIGMQLSGEKLSSAIKLCFTLAVITILFLLPINFFWWRALGWI